MSDLCKWALGILFTLILGAYGYTTTVDSSTNTRIRESENRVVTRLDRVEDKLDRLLERR